MKKKTITAMLAAVLAASMLAGCGSSAAPAAADSAESVSETESNSEQTDSSSEDAEGTAASSTSEEEEFVLEDYEYYNSAYDDLGFVYSKSDIDHYKRDEAEHQGTVETLEYETPAYAVNAVLGEEYTITKTLNVYLPYGYDASEQYDILYLMHGGGDDQDYWLMSENDRQHGEVTRNVLDNLIEEGTCKPLIVVTPTFYSPVDGVEVTGEQCETVLNEIGESNYTTIDDLYTYFFGDEFRNEIVPLIESTYSTYAGGDTSDESLIASRDHRAYSGLSMGSITSLHGIFMKNTDIISYVGSFSGAKTDVELFKNTLNEQFADYPLNYWFNGEGVEDIAFEEHYQFYEDVTSQMGYKFQDGVNSAMVVLHDGNHSWSAWITDLYNCLHVFFQDDATPVNGQALSLTNGEKNIYGEMYLPTEEQDTYPTVIISHGFGGSTKSNTYYAKMFAEAGYAACVFDFCGGGSQSQSDGDMTEMSVLTEASDLEAVMDQVKELPYVDALQLFLLGESQGGFVSSYVAAERADEVAALILYYPAFVLQDEAAERNPDPENMDETQEVMGQTIGRIYNEDALSFDIYDVIGNYKGDVLIIHGDADSVAPISYSERAVEVYENATLEVIEGAQHGFGGDNRYEMMENAGNMTIEFMNSHLTADEE